MAVPLSDALEGIQAVSEAYDGWIDAVLDSHTPRKRIDTSKDALRKRLEQEFLTPSTTFSSEWLNKLQQHWDAQPDYTSLFDLAPTQTRTIIRFTREGLEGRVTGYKEVTVPASSATAKNSTSLLRKPANRAEFVRGAAGFFPFAPGGLEGTEVTQVGDETLELSSKSPGSTARESLNRIIDFSAEGRLLEVPPGFTRGFKIQPNKSQHGDQGAAEVEIFLRESGDPSPANATSNQQKSSPNCHSNQNQGHETSEYEEEDIDAILPVEFPALEPRGQLVTSASRRVGREWAHMVDVNRHIPNFRELVPDMAKEWPFELDTFQKEAVYHLENGDSVFVAAHTSAGKTVVAEYAIALAAKHMTKAIYTSPIKALSNQKFRDFRQTFDEVGILTGDVQINPDASCLIMTTEILRSMLYRGADLIRDVEFVIFDEVHYVNDLERGVVWEEVIIMLPEHVTLILLSATVPNTYEFASWVGRTKKKDIYVISTPKRPVPLEHYLWANKGMHKIVDAEKRFLDKGWKDANDALSGKDKIKTPATPEKSQSQGGRGRGNGQRGGPQRGNSQQRGRGQPQRGGRGAGTISRPGRGGMRTTAAQDRNIWVHLVQHLRKEDLLPACIFVFSKRRCEENADALSNLDFCTASEKSAVHMIIEKSIARLKPEDRGLPQIRRLRELLSRGIAVHHGGLLPIVKEVVEILFARTLVKVLFATETFAMGLNLPTRTVVFSGYRKHDGRSFRDLLPGEYTQMAGRAGRRGLDPVGSVIIVAPGGDEAPPMATLKNMILGDPTKLRSQFRLTYNMILNLLRVEALKIEEMIKRSFSENATQALLPEHEKQVKLSEDGLSKIKREPCDICDADLNPCHQSSVDFGRLTAELHVGSLASPIGVRMFTPKRNSENSSAYFTNRSYQTGKNNGAPWTLFNNLPGPNSEISFEMTNVSLGDIECMTKTIVKFDLLGALKGDSDALQKGQEEVAGLYDSWMAPEWDELDWNRIKDMNLRNVLDERNKAAVHAQERCCIDCPNFLNHFSVRHDEWLIIEKVSQLRQLMSDQNLQLLPDYEQRIAVLKDLDFVDHQSRVQLKGKVACEIHSADELVLTELILENVLAEYAPEEIVALLSAFVFAEKTDVMPTLTPALEKGKETIIKIAGKVSSIQTEHQVILSGDDTNDFVTRPRFGLVEVVYEWARGMPFNRITDLTDVLEGTIVRVITRLDETCREVKNAARIIGDPTLFTKMQECQEMIKRDITAVASL
ncbi:hypothetical protein FGG08_001992 [Glutinoglossum americanum]|uniref:Antiviral helicase n=1 Tax=Glutinoglossum americanum TaxID=1670608 RepID=A0A9P8L4U1_9PEZI|nr:hypothetical protein FGG08_001992 [Glutinoglossum americanum]